MDTFWATAFVLLAMVGLCLRASGDDWTKLPIEDGNWAEIQAVTGIPA